MPDSVPESLDSLAQPAVVTDSPDTISASGASGASSSAASLAASPRSTPATFIQVPRQITITGGTLWSAAGIAATAILIALVVVKTLDFLLLMFFAITLAEAMRPAVDALERRRVPRAAGVLLIYLVSAAVLALLMWLLVAQVVDQVGTLQRNLPRQLVALQQLGAQLLQNLGVRSDPTQIVATIEHSVAQDAGALAPALISIPAAALSIPFAVFLVLSLALFWLTGADRLRPAVLGLLPIREQAHASSALEELGQSLGGYTRGAVINMLLIGGLTWLGLLILGVPYALLLGLATGLLQVIPLIGPWISGAMVALVALSSGGAPRMVAALILFVGLQQLEGAVIVPLVMSRSARLHPIVTLIATVIGGTLLGFFGAVMAVPLAIVVQVVVVRILLPSIQARMAHQQETNPG